jgi:hypothetical protein
LILLYIPLWIGAALLEVIGDGVLESAFGGFAGWLGLRFPMRLMYGSNWRREARRRIDMGRLAANGGLLRLPLAGRFERLR